jgi:hypothetical protein
MRKIQHNFRLIHFLCLNLQNKNRKESINYLYYYEKKSTIICVLPDGIGTLRRSRQQAAGPGDGGSVPVRQECFPSCNLSQPDAC